MIFKADWFVTENFSLNFYEQVALRCLMHLDSCYGAEGNYRSSLYLRQVWRRLDSLERTIWQR